MAEKKKKTVNEEPVVTTDQNMETYEEIFQIVKQNGVYYIGVANKLISKRSFANAEETKEYIDSKPWELVINVTCLIYDLAKENK